MTTLFGRSSSMLGSFVRNMMVTPVRTVKPYNIEKKVRNHFPRAKETKRVNTHGWAVRMSTPEGRRIIMRRILSGRHVLSH